MKTSVPEAAENASAQRLRRRRHKYSGWRNALAGPAARFHQRDEVDLRQRRRVIVVDRNITGFYRIGTVSGLSWVSDQEVIWRIDREACDRLCGVFRNTQENGGYNV